MLGKKDPYQTSLLMIQQTGKGDIDCEGCVFVWHHMWTEALLCDLTLRPGSHKGPTVGDTLSPAAGSETSKHSRRLDSEQTGVQTGSRASFIVSSILAGHFTALILLNGS